MMMERVYICAWRWIFQLATERFLLSQDTFVFSLRIENIHFVLIVLCLNLEAVIRR